MSKSALKSHYRALTKDQLIAELMELYDNFKPVKEYLEYKLTPNPWERLAFYRNLILEEFYPRRKTAEPKMRLAVAKKAIADFRKLNPSPEMLADLMFFYVETGVQFTLDYGDIHEAFYSSMESMYLKALEYIDSVGLLTKFEERASDIMDKTVNIGWGFHDTLSDYFYQYYS